MWTKEFFSDRDYNLYIKNIEKQVRGSIEYKNWIQKLREERGAYKCLISGSTIDDCTIEIHHLPFTLYDIVDIVISNQKERFCTFTISLEVMQLHFDDFVGWVPLTHTLHEKVHNNIITIKPEQIRGKFIDFASNYKIPKDIWRKVSPIFKELGHGNT